MHIAYIALVTSYTVFVFINDPLCPLTLSSPNLITPIHLYTLSCAGFYIQPDVLFLSEHPRSQLIVPDSSFSLSCAVQLRGLRAEEGNLGVPIVQWSINETNVRTVRV